MGGLGLQVWQAMRGSTAVGVSVVLQGGRKAWEAIVGCR